MEFRVIPLQIRGLTEPHEAAVFSNREHCNTGGTVVNPDELIIPQRFSESLRVSFCFGSLPQRTVINRRLPHQSKTAERNCNYEKHCYF
jgi:hypothetical protein